MANFYVVEFPAEADDKSKGPHLVAGSKVRENKDCSSGIEVEWSVVDSGSGKIRQEYFEAVQLTKGIKKYCADFIDRLKAAREEAKITNTIGRKRHKPAKLRDYDEDLDNTDHEELPLNKNKANRTSSSMSSSCLDLDSDSEEVTMEEENKKSLLKTVKSNSANDSSRQKPASKSNTKSFAPRKADTASKKTKNQGKKSISLASAQKKARLEIADLQSQSIDKSIPSTMSLIRQLQGSEVDFILSIDSEMTFADLRKKLLQTTGIPTEKQRLILRGKEWKMEDNGNIHTTWTPDDVVAIMESHQPLVLRDSFPIASNKSVISEDEHSDDYFASKNSEALTNEQDNWTDDDSEGYRIREDPLHDFELPMHESTNIEGSTTPSNNGLEDKINLLLQQSQTMANQLQQLKDIVGTFAKCKGCLKKTYRVVDAAQPPPAAAVVNDPLPNCLAPSTLPPVATPKDTMLQTKDQQPAKKFDGSPRSLSQKFEDKANDNLVLIGSPSRGIYINDTKFKLLNKSSPKLFALKLTEHLFSREEAGKSSVEGKGNTLSKLDPNRIAAIKEQLERSFPETSDQWNVVKKAIDEKCRMVRNNRCFVWAGINHKDLTKNSSF